MLTARIMQSIYFAYVTCAVVLPEMFSYNEIIMRMALKLTAPTKPIIPIINQFKVE